MVTPLDEEVAARIHRHGPITCAPVVDLALYDPDHGFYGSGRVAPAGAATSSPAPRSVPCSAR